MGWYRSAVMRFDVQAGVVCVAAVALAALGLAGCASAPRHAGGSRPARASDDKPYDFRSEGRIPPAENNVPVEPDVEEIPLNSGALDVSEAEAPPPDTTRAPEAPASAPDTTVDGFRVQLFASADREVAENAARVARERLGVRAYVDLDGGMYKVRVGDYARRTDAESALATMRRHYYPDAWIVPAKVRVPRNPARP